MSHVAESAIRPQPDKVLQDIADYVHNYEIDSALAFETARLCLIDTIGCGLEGLRFDACARLMGPVVEGTVVPNGKQHRTLISSCFELTRYYLQALKFQERTFRSIPSAVRSILARKSAGSTSMTAGSPRSGATPPIT